MKRPTTLLMLLIALRAEGPLALFAKSRVPTPFIPVQLGVLLPRQKCDPSEPSEGKNPIAAFASIVLHTQFRWLRDFSLEFQSNGSKHFLGKTILDVGVGYRFNHRNRHLIGGRFAANLLFAFEAPKGYELTFEYLHKHFTISAVTQAPPRLNQVHLQRLRMECIPPHWLHNWLVRYRWLAYPVIEADWQSVRTQNGHCESIMVGCALAQCIIQKVGLTLSAHLDCRQAWKTPSKIHQYVSLRCLLSGKKPAIYQFDPRDPTGIAQAMHRVFVSASHIFCQSRLPSHTKRVAQKPSESNRALAQMDSKGHAKHLITLSRPRVHHPMLFGLENPHFDCYANSVLQCLIHDTGLIPRCSPASHPPECSQCKPDQPCLGLTLEQLLSTLWEMGFHDTETHNPSVTDTLRLDNPLDGPAEGRPSSTDLAAAPNPLLGESESYPVLLATYWDPLYQALAHRYPHYHYSPDIHHCAAEYWTRLVTANQPFEDYFSYVCCWKANCRCDTDAEQLTKSAYLQCPPPLELPSATFSQRMRHCIENRDLAMICKNPHCAQPYTLSQFIAPAALHIERTVHTPEEPEEAVPLAFSFSPPIPDQAPIAYRLLSAVLYDGNGEKGHYRACVRKGEQWFLCDDACITAIALSEAQAIISQSASQLNYERLLPS